MEIQNGESAPTAEELKLLANEAFNARKYGQSIELYSQAIDLNSQNAVYWANRAFAHTKLEEYGSAVEDATKAIEIDPEYSKGYYRRGAAYLAMGTFKEALKDFQQVKRLCPLDPDAAKKLKECENALMMLKFEETISLPQSEKHSVAESIDYHTIGTDQGSSYLSPKAIISAVIAAVIAIVVLVMRKATTSVFPTAVSAAMVFIGVYLWYRPHGSAFIWKPKRFILNCKGCKGQLIIGITTPFVKVNFASLIHSVYLD